MSLRVAIQMDHISSINIAGDTTFALALEAERRGHSLWHYTPDQLFQRGNKAFARAQSLQVRDIAGDHYTMQGTEVVDLSQMDVVLLRQDPPFDMQYITTTHILDCIHPSTLVVNDPFWVRNCPEKIFITQFPDLMPETLITRDPIEVDAFRREFGDIIIKPLYGNGGAGIFHMKQGDRNLASLLELFIENFREPFIVQRYLNEVRGGDKRILLIDGNPVGAINRVPAEHDSRSNMHAGGTAEPTQITAREREICERIGPALREKGQILVGIDVIGNYMTEINVTSPTGVREVKRFGGEDVASLFWDTVETRRSSSQST